MAQLPFIITTILAFLRKWLKYLAILREKVPKILFPPPFHLRKFSQNVHPLLLDPLLIDPGEYYTQPVE